MIYQYTVEIYDHSTEEFKESTKKIKFLDSSNPDKEERVISAVYEYLNYYADEYIYTAYYEKYLSREESYDSDSHGDFDQYRDFVSTDREIRKLIEDCSTSYLNDLNDFIDSSDMTDNQKVNAKRSIKKASKQFTEDLIPQIGDYHTQLNENDFTEELGIIGKALDQDIADLQSTQTALDKSKEAESDLLYQLDQEEQAAKDKARHKQAQAEKRRRKKTNKKKQAAKQNEVPQAAKTKKNSDTTRKDKKKKSGSKQSTQRSGRNTGSPVLFGLQEPPSPKESGSAGLSKLDKLEALIERAKKTAQKESTDQRSSKKETNPLEFTAASTGLEPLERGKQRRTEKQYNNLRKMRAALRMEKGSKNEIDGNVSDDPNNLLDDYRDNVREAAFERRSKNRPRNNSVHSM